MLDYRETFTRRANLRALVGGSAAGALALVVRTAGPGAGTAAAQTPPANVIPVDFTSTLGAFTGNYTVSQFLVQDGVLNAVGQLTGTVTNALGAVLGTIDQALTLPVSNIQGTCDLLHLELGPLDLDLLGLKVHLDKVVLDLTAQSGPGELLGNLLCAVADLLNANGPLSQVADLLNQILGQL